VLNIALPKGRLGEKAYDLFARAGYECGEIFEDSRKLLFESAARGVRYLLVKPADVPVYVAHGAADIGVVGRDVLLESESDVYELMDLGFGACRICVAGRADCRPDPDRALRVATKFANIAKRYYSSLGRDVEIIKLNGSIELAPLSGLSDVIVDIVESGKTLAENDLAVLETILPVSARLIANKSSYMFLDGEINKILAGFKEVVSE
jgi:ATP phosphoribosyltransferase